MNNNVIFEWTEVETLSEDNTTDNTTDVVVVMEKDYSWEF